jgi:hypothetical protein
LGQLEIDLAVPAREAWAAARRAAAAWGAELEGDEEGGRFELPVVAGLRRGLLSGRVELGPGPGTAFADASRLSLVVERSDYRLHAASVVVLLISALGAVLTVLWPFDPDLLRVAPFGAVLALCGWFLVLSRLRNSGPAEFLKAVEKEAEAGAAEPEEGAPTEGLE